ncbi:MAG: hypothetical protein ACRDFX_08975 [Chloroflexota bacterium]
MIRMSGAIIALVCCVSVISQAHASGQPRGSHRRAASVACDFRLNVKGTPSAPATFWVAYGPLDGKFGIIRLHAVGNGQYRATKRLPRNGKSQFVYVEGQGVVHTRAGAVPGGNVITIKNVGMVVLARQSVPSVLFHTHSVG